MAEDLGGESRRSKLFGSGSSGVGYVLIAITSTVVMFGVFAALVVNSPNWPDVKQAFFSGYYFRTSFRPILDAFWLNVKIFCVAEVCILAFAMAIAVVRSLPGPVMFPLRALAIIYTDLFRGVPTLIVVYLLGFGVPALQLPGLSNDPIVWGTLALILVYSAYVAEVYRAGIESVHPSQEAAARSLGLSRLQTMRYVILPQAVRRVIPPLLNDFIGLQKDTALVGLLGVAEALRDLHILEAADFNYTPLVVAACIFIALTIPMCRLADWLVARQRSRQQAGRVA